MEDKGKQKVVAIYNDKTRYVKFQRNENDQLQLSENVEIEMGEMGQEGETQTVIQNVGVNK